MLPPRRILDPFLMMLFHVLKKFVENAPYAGSPNSSPTCISHKRAAAQQAANNPAAVA
jgi:hypothetical protein